MAEKRRANTEKGSELIRLLQSIAKLDPGTICSNSNAWSMEEINFFKRILTDYDYNTKLKLDDEHIYAKLSKLMIGGDYKKPEAEIKNLCINLKQKLANHKLEGFHHSNMHDNTNQLGIPTDIVIKGEVYDHSMGDIQELQSNFIQESEIKGSRGIRKNNWTLKETECIVDILEKYGMPNRNNFREISLTIMEYLKHCGFARTEEQIQIKIKQLRSLYNQVIRKRIKQDDFPFFHRIKKILHSNKLNDKEDTHSFITIDDLSKTLDFEDSINDNYDEDSTTRKGRQIWTNKEVQVLLKFLEDNNIVTGKQLRKMCHKAVEYLSSYGYIRSPTQILIRWKNTKAVYWSTFRKKLLHPERECSFFYQLHSMLNPNDKSYETRILEIEENDDLISGNFEIIDSTKLAEGLNFRLSKNLHNQLGDLKDNTSHKANSIDFLNMQNSVASKRLPNTEVICEPIENLANVEVIPSSPKRSRTDPTPCSSCNTLDSIDHYCISLAHSIKRLDARKQAKLKIEIQQLMYKAEFDLNF